MHHNDSQSATKNAMRKHENRERRGEGNKKEERGVE
jgi:hypothetical protein